MCYAAESWPKAVDLESAVRRISSQLCDFQHDAILQQNRGYQCWNYQNLKDDEEQYGRGIILCDMYLSGKIDLKLFCDLLLCIKLKSFLWSLKHFLPNEITLRYQMQLFDNVSDNGDADFNIHDHINCTACSLGEDIRDFVFFE